MTYRQRYYDESIQQWIYPDSLAINDGSDRVDVQRVKNIEDNNNGFTRDAIHSGFTNLGILTFLPTTANTFRLAPSTANVNGHRVEIPQTDIVLPVPPLTGRRDDLVYLLATIANFRATYTIERVAGATLTSLGFTRSTTDRGLWTKGSEFALPMFSVRRRNSGGFSEQNPHGSVNYLATTLSAVASVSSPTITVASATDLVVGDQIRIGTTSVYIIRSISTNTLTLDRNADTAHANASTVVRVPYRPNGKYSNIVYATDVSDIRHRVYLTGVDKNVLLQREFDAYMKGLRGNQEMVRERFNLERAPQDLQTQLMPTKVSTPDGDKWLVNLLGDKSRIWTQGLINTGSGIEGSATNRLRSSTVNTTPNSYLHIRSTVPYEIFVFEYNNSTLIKNSVAWLSSIKIQVSATTNNIRLVIRKSDNSNIIPSEILTALPLIYEISQADFDKIDVLPEWTGEQLAQRFPYVDSVPNAVENLIPPFSQWTLHANARLSNDYDLTLNATSGYQNNILNLSVLPNTQYTFNVSTSGGLVIYSVNASGTITTTHLNKDNTNVFNGHTFTTDSTAVIVRIQFYNTLGQSGIFTFTRPQLVKGTQPNPVFVPFGRYFLSHDYATGQTKTRLELMNGKRQILSDAQTSENVFDVISPLNNSHLPHVTVTQATAGQWSVNDTIRIRSVESVMTGVIDGDTAVVNVTGFIQVTTNPSQLYVDDVSKLSVNDTLRLARKSDLLDGGTVTVTAIDVPNKMITVNSALTNAIVDWLMIETTASTSSPLVTATGIAGTWTGLGTREMTYTITTVPTDNKTDILLNYSKNYPSGRGIDFVPSEVLEAEVNGQRLTKQGNTVVVRANFEGKTAGNNDRVGHVSRWANGTSLVSPTGGTEHPQGDYDRITSLDNVTQPRSITGNGAISQHLFSFNLIRAITDKYGEGVFADCNTEAQRVAKLRGTAPYSSALISRIVGNWWGYGSSPSGNKANFRIWRLDSSSWVGTSFTGMVDNHTQALSTKLSQGFALSAPQSIDNNGFVHFLAHADPSDGTTASIIHTDYVELELELNLAETGYEVLQPVHKLPVLSDSPLLHKEGENLLPPFTNPRWSLHANARVISDYELELNATGVSQFSNSTIPVIPNTTYTFTSNGGLFGVNELSNSNSFLRNRIQNTNNFTFTTSSDAFFVQIATYQITTGTFTFKQPKLELGSTFTGFSPSKIRNKRRNLFTFRGKIQGSTWENPHRIFVSSGNTPLNVTTEVGQSVYNAVAKQDGVVDQGERIYEYDVSHLGLSLTNAKNLFRRATVNRGGTSTIQMWNATTNAWSSVSTTTSSDFINRSQKIYVLINGDTDFVNLLLEMSDEIDYVKSNCLKVRASTKEIKLQYPTYSARTGRTDDVSLFYNHLPKQRITALGTNVTELVRNDDVIASTIGTGAFSTEVNRLVYELLDNTSIYLGQSLHTFMTKGLRKLPIVTDTMETQAIDTLNAYVASVPTLILFEGELYLRVYFQESRLISNSRINPTTYIDFRLNGRPLIKGVN